MAETTTLDTTTSTEDGSESSESDVLTAEQRDAQTFAKYGMNPDGSPMETPAVADPTPASDEDADDDADDADGDADADPDDDTADPDADDDAEPVEVEITDEDFDAVVEAALELNAERIAQNPRLRETIEKQVREELEARYETERRSATANQERTVLIRQGREAVDRIVTTANSVAKALQDAKEGNEFDGSSFDLNTLGRDLQAYGAAAVADTRRSYDDAFSGGFREATKIGGPLTEEERDRVIAIVNTANRIEGDEAQGDGRFDAAKNHLYTETWKLTVSRAYEAGRVAALAEARSKREASKKILDAGAVLAGAAKEAKARGALPPSPTPAGTTESSAVASMDAYRAAKIAGDFALADKIAAELAAQKPAPRRR